MSFYNPYMQGPDIGQGIQGIMQNLIQVLMMKKMFSGEQGPSPEQQALGQSATVGPVTPEAMGGIQGPPPMGPQGPNVGTSGMSGPSGIPPILSGLQQQAPASLQSQPFQSVSPAPPMGGDSGLDPKILMALLPILMPLLLDQFRS